MARRCSREASSGTTPPYLPCVESCEATTDDNTRTPSSTTAAAVSSHDDSIAKIRIVRGYVAILTAACVSTSLITIYPKN